MLLKKKRFQSIYIKKTYENSNEKIMKNKILMKKILKLLIKKIKYNTSIKNTHIIKLIFEAYKKTDKIFLYIFFSSIYKKWQINIIKYKKQTHEKYQNIYEEEKEKGKKKRPKVDTKIFLKKKKKKNVSMNVNVIRIFLKKKKKIKLSIWKISF